MKKIGALLIFLTLISYAHAQQRAADSLKKLIATAKDDTTKVLLMHILTLSDGRMKHQF